MVDFRFTDLLGAWHRFSVPLVELHEGVFEEGLAFDGSSIKGWCGVEASDMMLVPDSTTAFIDPFLQHKTLGLICTVHEPITREAYARCPRALAQRAMSYIQGLSYADTAYFGPEAEFFMFDQARFGSRTEGAFYEIDSAEGSWNTGAPKCSPDGYQISAQGGYLPVLPFDRGIDIRQTMVKVMMELGLHIEREHHEVATAGQSEISLRYDTLLRMADQMMLYKYVARNVAVQHGKTVTFMPKPLYDTNGSGMHVHVSLWKKDIPLMAGDLYAGLSQEALWFIGGLLKHAPAFSAICNPSNNSYKRLVPGYEAPVNLTYSARNRSAVCRIPVGAASPKARRIELRSPDPSANCYLALSAIVLAGIDGIENKIDPGMPMEQNLYKLSAEARAHVPTLPESLKEAIEALEADHTFLLKGNIFSKDLIRVFTDMKKAEYDAIRRRPHPYEYMLYYGI